MTQSAKYGLILTMSYSLVDEMSELTDFLNETRGLTFSEGTTANKINLIFHDEVALAGGANHTKNFHDGTLTNKVGQTITMDIFKGIYVKNKSTDSTLIIGNSGANGLALFGAVAHTIVLQPGGEWIFLAPDASGVDCSVNADLKFEHGNEGASAPGYDLIAVGVDSP